MKDLVCRCMQMTIIMSESSDELQQMLNVINKYSVGFCVNFGTDKSLIRIVNSDEEDRDKVWTLCANQMKRTDEYKYLINKGCEKAKSEKISKAKQWCGRLASIARYRANKYVVVRVMERNGSTKYYVAM